MRGERGQPCLVPLVIGMVSVKIPLTTSLVELTEHKFLMRSHMEGEPQFTKGDIHGFVGDAIKSFLEVKIEVLWLW